MFLDIPSLAIIDSFLTFLPVNTQGRESVRVKVVVLLVVLQSPDQDKAKIYNTTIT